MEENKSEEHKKALSVSQAGGHEGIMIFENNRVLKKSKQPEISFFQWLYSQDTPMFKELQNFAPHFYGVEARNGNNYIVLENLLTEYDYPNIMDCKLGRITWDSDCPEDVVRVRRQRNSLTTTETLGFRLCGLVVKDNHGEKVEQLVSKKDFQQINDQNIHEYFKKIVTDQGALQVRVVEQFIQETERLKNWFERNTEKHIKSSSVFYVNGKNGRCQVRYIDFAHAEPANGQVDSNVIEGLENCIRVWRKLLN